MLVDTSVWVELFRRGHDGLEERLEAGAVVSHPFVIGELACGHLRDRTTVLELLNALPASPVADHDEVLLMVGAHRLMASGLGWVDMHLLAAALLSGERLWTLDRALALAAKRLRVEYVHDRGEPG